MAAGAVSLKLPNFLTTSQDVTKGADQANYACKTLTLPGHFAHSAQIQPGHTKTARQT